MQEKTLLQTKQLGVGFAVGALNGLFGGGGGMLAVPLLKRLGYAEKCAHATAILVILPVCVCSLFLYIYRGFFSASVVIPTALGVTGGGVLGAKLLQVLPEQRVRVIFALLQMLAGAFLLFF